MKPGGYLCGHSVKNNETPFGDTFMAMRPRIMKGGCLLWEMIFSII